MRDREDKITYGDVVKDEKDIIADGEDTTEARAGVTADSGAARPSPTASAKTAQANPSGSGTPLSVVATYTTLEGARRAVKRLAEAGFEPTEVSLHGTGFKIQASKRRFWQGALFRGSVAGLAAGATVGLLFGLVSLTSVVSGLFYTVFSEMVLGAATGFIGFMAARARGGFQSKEDKSPQQFGVMVPAALAGRATEALSQR